MGRQTADRSRAARRVLGVAIAWTIAMTLAAAPVSVRAADSVLRWKFSEGQTLHYQMDQKTVTQVKGTNQDIKTTVNQIIDTTWAVLAVDKQTGTATLTQTIDRVRTKIEFPFGALEYDSKSEKAPEGPLAASGVIPTLKALVGAKFQYKMTPQGELSDVQVPEDLVKVLKESGPGGGAGAGMFSEDGLKNMIHESSLVLPKDAQKDRSWTRQTKIPSPPIGTLTLDKTYSYTGPEKEGDKITLDVKIRLEPDPKANLDIKLASQEGKGTFFFNSKAGNVVQSTVTEKMDVVVKLMNMEVNHITDMSTVMKLIEAK